jgi:hypothetical protein
MSVRYFIFLAITIFQFEVIHPQVDTTKTDSLFYYNDIKFESDSEKNCFGQLKGIDEYKYFNLAIYAKPGDPEQPLENYKRKFDKVILTLDKLDVTNKKPDKLIKTLYGEIHYQLLRKYENYSSFEDLFINGNYNCVTASILVALVLTHYNIPYHIKETTNHVFIVALPQSKSILIETTNPIQGTLVYNSSFKSKFVEYLKKSKIVTDNDVVKMGVDSVFEKFFMATTSIGLQQLIGLQYFNNGVYATEKEDYKSSLGQLLRSYYLYPTKRVEYILFNVLYNLTEKATYLDKYDWVNYTLISRFAGKIFSVDNLNTEFERLTSKILIEKSNIFLYDSAFNFISEQIKDTTLLKEISFVYHYESGRYFLISNKWKEGLVHLVAAYRIKPENYQVQNMLLACFFATIPEYLTNNNDGIAQIEKFYYKFEKLQKNNKLLEALLEGYLFKADQSYMFGAWETGDKYLAKFENLKDQHPDFEYRNYIIGEVYKKPAAHFFKLYKINEARKYILRGLKYAPDDYSLKNSLEIMK